MRGPRSEKFIGIFMEAKELSLESNTCGEEGCEVKLEKGPGPDLNLDVL